MRVAVVGVGLVFALSGCRCLSSVDEQTADAGLSGDGGVLSRDGGALTDDGGSPASDGGVLSVDGGALSSDGGALSHDGGALDSGSPITDAGPNSLDAGTTGRDGGPGASDAATPIAEVCDGIDNDLDGLIDETPDGAVLSRDCPLTLGVCLNVKSLCGDGGYQACDYGANYQLTEHNCDGLDNDCDGRIDKSWVRTLSKPATDAAPTFWWGETTYQQLNRVGGRFILTLPASVLELDDDLRISWRTTFPTSGPIGEGRLIPSADGDGWIRVFFEDTAFPACVNAHRLYADGGYPTLSNGDPALTARQCDTTLNWIGPGLATVLPSGAIARVDETGQPPLGGFGRYYSDLLDGGTGYSSFGNDLPWYVGYRSIASYRDGFLVSWTSSPQGQTRIDSCSSPFVCAPIATLPSQDCRLASVAPLVFACLPSMDSSQHERFSDWYFGDGGVIQMQLSSTNPIRGQMDPLGRPFATQNIIGTDGKAAGFALVEVRASGVFEYERLTIPGSIKGIGLAPIDQELHLLMWSDQMPYTDPSYEFYLKRFNAEYLCLP